MNTVSEMDQLADQFLAQHGGETEYPWMAISTQERGLRLPNHEGDYYSLASICSLDDPRTLGLDGVRVVAGSDGDGLGWRLSSSIMDEVGDAEQVLGHALGEWRRYACAAVMLGGEVADGADLADALADGVTLREIARRLDRHRDWIRRRLARLVAAVDAVPTAAVIDTGDVCVLPLRPRGKRDTSKINHRYLLAKAGTTRRRARAQQTEVGAVVGGAA